MFFSTSLWVGVLAFSATAGASHPHRAQQPFPDFVGAPALGGAYDEGLFTPAVEDLSELRTERFTTLQHPAYPKHSVRIKQSKFCDETVNAYTGYIDIEAKHLFFYFFESRSEPDKDDVIFWTNGGPGCSSSIGLFMELGPCRIADANGTTFNPHAWNENANVFFIDQPVGVGFSYADHGESVSTSEDAAIDVAAFVFIFFEHFSKFKGRSFHMAGESYGGRYIPLFASAVYDLNARLVAGGYTPINLTSIMIGNGWTDPYTMVSSYFDMQCTPASVPPVSDIAACTRMKQAVPRCEKMMKASCVDRFDAMDCGAAMLFCGNEINDPFFATGMNPYDISKVCDGPISETLCYPVTKHISNYLSQPSTHHLLGVDPAITGNFTSCSPAVGAAFDAHLDATHQTQHHVAALLERGVRALIYVGELDWICNWVGNERWTRALEWSGGSAFAAEALGTWDVGGRVVGKVRSSGKLTFATIKGAGHMVPYDKPKESLEMVQRWLAGEAL